LVVNVTFVTFHLGRSAHIANAGMNTGSEVGGSLQNKAGAGDRGGKSLKLG